MYNISGMADFIRFIGKLRIQVLCLAAILIFGTQAKTQILQDSTSVNRIKKCIGYIYNFQFRQAGELFEKIDQDFPDHPATLVLRGLLTYWENYPLLPTSAACNSFEKDLKDCILMCEKKHNPDYDAEYLLTSLCARGFLLLFYSDNDLSVEVFPLVTSSYQNVRRSYNFTSYFPDFYFFTGLYDYYREAYPDAYPIYEALAILFPRGDKAKGLKSIINAARNSIFLKAESYLFLTTIYQCYENNFSQATYYSKSLCELYPQNPEYRSEYIKNLLLEKKYNEAEEIMLNPRSANSNSYYSAQLDVFSGIIQEKKYHDFNKAEQYYNKGIRNISLYGDFGNNYTSFCYFGLSRISEIKGESQYKRSYRKLALKLVEFRKINFDE
jgi:hypothetical protein